MTTAISLSQFDQAARKGGTILGYQDKDHITVRGTGTHFKGRIVRWVIHSRQKRGFHTGSGELVRLHYARQTRGCLLDALRMEYGKDIAGELDARFRIRLAPEELSANRVSEILEAGRSRREQNNTAVYQRYIAENPCSEIQKLLAWQAMMEKTENHQKSIDLATLAEWSHQHEQMLENAVHTTLVRYTARLTDPDRQFLGHWLTHPSIARLPSTEREKAIGLITESYLVHGQPIQNCSGPLAVYRSFGIEPVSDSIDPQNLVPVLYRDLCRFQEKVEMLRQAAEENMTAIERRIFRHITGPEWTGGLRFESEYEAYFLRMASRIQEIVEYAAKNDFSLKPRDVWRMVTGMDPPGEVEQHNFARFLIDAGKQQEYKGLEEYRLSIANNLSGRRRLIFRSLTHNRLIRELKNSHDRKNWIDLVRAHIQSLGRLPNRFDQKDVWRAILKTPMPNNVAENDFFIRLIQKSRPVDSEYEHRLGAPQFRQADGPQVILGVAMPEEEDILEYMDSVMDGVMLLTDKSRRSVVDMLVKIKEKIEQPPEKKYIRPESHYSLGSMVIQSDGHNLPMEKRRMFYDKYELHFYCYVLYWGLLGEYAKMKGHQLYFKVRHDQYCTTRQEVDFENINPTKSNSDILSHFEEIWDEIVFDSETDAFPPIEVILLPLIEDPKRSRRNRDIVYKRM